jgi:hypothetical protein
MGNIERVQKFGKTINGHGNASSLDAKPDKKKRIVTLSKQTRHRIKTVQFNSVLSKYYVRLYQNINMIHRAISTIIEISLARLLQKKSCLRCRFWITPKEYESIKIDIKSKILNASNQAGKEIKVLPEHGHEAILLPLNAVQEHVKHMTGFPIVAGQLWSSRGLTLATGNEGWCPTNSKPDVGAIETIKTNSWMVVGMYPTTSSSTVL